MTYETKSTTPKSRRRRRTEKAAIELLSKARLGPGERRCAIDRIRRARQPMAEAKRIVAQANRLAVRHALHSNDARPPATVDHSDVQELRVKIIRRDGWIVEPHISLLRRLDGRIATGAMTRDEFEDVASQVWAMPRALPGSRPTAQLESIHDRVA